MADLEAVAKWCDEIAKEAKEAMLADDAARLRAAAVACREAIARRNDPETKGYESASTRAAATETDAALNAITEAP